MLKSSILFVCLFVSTLFNVRELIWHESIFHKALKDGILFICLFIFGKEPVIPFSAKQGKHWYHFYNIFGMTRSLTGDWTRDLPHSMPALYH